MTLGTYFLLTNKLIYVILKKTKRGNDMKRLVKSMDKPLLIITLLLFVFGLVMIFSASNVTAYMKYSASPYRYFIKQALFLSGSFVLSLFLIRHPPFIIGQKLREKRFLIRTKAS